MKRQYPQVCAPVRGGERSRDRRHLRSLDRGVSTDYRLRGNRGRHTLYSSLF